ncbi:MAG: questin oxidase family protein [Ancalomicrobiaceae bacterium]|nr:questin oxidase family protein [Ancalomicrobiaceae bacterium]
MMPNTPDGLDRALAVARQDSVEFPRYLANHAPMVLMALDRLGASSDRLDNWYDAYRAKNGLVPLPPPVAPITEETWRASLGDRSREADYRAFFTIEVQRLGLPLAISQYLPTLIPGVAGSALHPLMRLAYAVLNNDPVEAGAALGYWATTYLPLPAAGRHPATTEDPGQVLAMVGEIEGTRGYEVEIDLLWHHIRHVSGLTGFAPLVDRLKFTSDTPRLMAATALALFAGTMDFSALHSVTGLHWIRLIAPNLENPEPLYRAFWQVIAALVPHIGFPSLPGPDELAAMRAVSAPPWEDIKLAAIASNDEHDISLVYSAWSEEQVWRDSLYRVVAARRVGLI